MIHQYQYFMNMGPLTAEAFGNQLFDITWNAIGHDAFQPGLDGKVRRQYRRSEVFDMCFDYLHIAMESGRKGISEESIRGLQNHFMSLKPTTQKRFIRAVLDSRYYGE